MTMTMERGGSLYASTARFDTGRALGESEMRALAPSIFATTPHESRSARFTAIPTIEVLRGLANEGFQPVAVKQCRVRDQSKFEFTKHLIRLRRFDDESKYKVGDTVAEILLKNGNDGSCAYDILAGLFKILCLNSLVAMTEAMESYKVTHTGNIRDKVIEGTYKVLDTAVMQLEATDKWAQIRLDREEARIFAEEAHAIRFADADGKIATPVTAQQLLIPRRTADTEPNLWNVFNVVQENAVKGGLTAMGRDAHNRPRRSTTREIKGIDQDVKVNRALFSLAAKMAELKAA